MQRALLTLSILLVVSLAGCTDDSEQSGGKVVSPEKFVVPEVPFADAAAVLSDLEFFSKTYSERAANLPAHEGARDWMLEQFDSYGLTAFSQHFENGIPQQNVVGLKYGAVRDQWVVIGGHYDMTTTLGVDRPTSEGAYDDGSGTMMTLHLAKAFADIDTYYSIAFVAFDGEERGLQGSRAFAEALIVEDEFTCANQAVTDTIEEVEGAEQFCTPGSINVVGMLNLDMFGLNWPGVDAPMYFDTNSEGLNTFVAGVATEIGIPDDMIKFQGINLGRSDYANFFSHGVPTGFFISDFEEFQLPADIPVTTPAVGGVGGAAYPFWHLADTYETLILMAGSLEDAIAGFQVGMDLSSHIIHLMAAQPSVKLDAVVA